MLAQYNGVPMKNGKVTVQYEYYEDAQEVLRHSALTLSHYAWVTKQENLLQKLRKQDEKVQMKRYRKRTDSIKEMTPVEWVEQYVDKKGGAVEYIKMANSKPLYVISDNTTLKAAIAESDKLEVVGRPAIVKMKDSNGKK